MSEELQLRSLTINGKKFVIPLGEMESEISALQQDMADLKYAAIDITSVSNSIGTVELGSTVDTVTVNWAVNKEPVSQTVNGEAIAADLRTLTLKNLGLTKETAITVTATDERGATDKATTRVYFYNGVYYGVLEDGTELDSAAILGLTRKLQSGKTITFTVNPGEAQRIAFALPARYGTPIFNIGGFDYEWDKATIQFVNSSGYEEAYDIWLSPQTGLGSTTVKVT